MIDLAAHRPLAVAISRDFFFPGADRDDVEQEAMIALWIAARSFDGTGSFRGFAAMVIRRRLASVVRAYLREKHRPLTERAVDEIRTEDGVLSLLDCLPAPASDPARIVEDREELAHLARVIADDLSPTERLALLHVVNGGSRTQEKWIDNAFCRARRKLAGSFEVAA